MVLDRTHAGFNPATPMNRIPNSSGHHSSSGNRIVFNPEPRTRVPGVASRNDVRQEDLRARSAGHDFSKPSVL
jgi:hypothetical protein